MEKEIEIAMRQADAVTVNDVFVQMYLEAVNMENFCKGYEKVCTTCENLDNNAHGFYCMVCDPKCSNHKCESYEKRECLKHKKN